MPVLQPQALVDDRVAALRAFHRRIGVPRAELDVSGGIDSAVMLGLLARALGPGQITAVHSVIHSAPSHLARAREAAEAFGVPLVVVELTSLYEELVETMRAALLAAGHDGAALDDRLRRDPTVLGSIRSTLRAPVGRGFNRMAGGGIRHGTGNECEDRWVRFYQKGGDGEVDTNPLAMLSKVEVVQLAHALGVPRSVREAVPSPDLWGQGDRHNDEDELAALFDIDAVGHGHGFYGTVCPDTGAALRAGLIERVSRWLDLGGEAVLFAAEPDDALHDALRAAPDTAPFRGLETPLIHALLRAARRLEAATRHKRTLAPALGCRADLVASGILTDMLPA